MTAIPNGLSGVIARKNAGGGSSSITIDSTSSTWAGSSTTPSFSNTQGTVTDGYVLLTMSYWSGGHYIDSCTYDGVSLASVASGSNGGSANVKVWGAALGSNSSGSKTVSITMDSSTQEIAVGVVVFSGVNQTTPVGTVVNMQGSTLGTYDLDVTASSGDVIVGQGATFSSLITPSAGQTVQWYENAGGSNTDGHCDTKPAVSSTTNIEYAFSANKPYIVMGIPILQL